MGGGVVRIISLSSPSHPGGPSGCWKRLALQTPHSSYKGERSFQNTSQTKFCQASQQDSHEVSKCHLPELEPLIVCLVPYTQCSGLPTSGLRLCCSVSSNGNHVGVSHKNTYYNCGGWVVSNGVFLVEGTADHTIKRESLGLH